MRRVVRRIWASRWTPAIVVLAMTGTVLVVRKAPGRATFELDVNMLVSGNPHLREVCLTFDDGPHPGSMEKILAVLKAENVKASFFVVGKVVDKHPDIVRRMMAEGHEVGNHTYTHKRLDQMPLASARQEIAACAASVKRATGADMTLLRPPGMKYNNDVLYLAQELGYVTCHWNVVVADYVPVAPSLIVSRVMDQVKDGSVVLLHDSPDTAQALTDVIRSLRKKGYRFVTASQMLARLPRPVFVATNAYAVKPEVLVTKSVAVQPRRRLPAGFATQRTLLTAAPASKRRGPVLDAPVWDGASSPRPQRVEDDPS